MSSFADIFKAVFTGNPVDPTKRPKPSDAAAIGAVLDEALGDITSLATSGGKWVDPVDVATTTNVNLATALAAGQTIDGKTLVTGQRVGVTLQSAPAQNGVYVVPASGAASRATDADTGAELVGLAFYVRAGTANGGKQYICTTPATIVIGTTAISFRVVSDQSALNANLTAVQAAQAANDADIIELQARSSLNAVFVAAVDVATTANVALTSGLAAGQTIDGKVLITGQRVGVIAQTAAAENGVYVVPATGTASRATDANSAAELLGIAFFVNTGTANGGKQFVCTAEGPITVGTTALPFGVYSDQSAVNAKIESTTALTTSVQSDVSVIEPKVAPITVEQQNYEMSVGDENGNVLFGVTKDRLYAPNKTGDYVDGNETNYDFCIKDANGFVVFGVLKDGTVVGGGGTGTGDSLAVRDRQNVDRSRQLQATKVTTVQRMTAAFNSLVTWGQSLGRGNETWPALSRLARLGNLMLGNHVGPKFSVETDYQTIGTAALNDLVAVTASGDALVSDPTEAGLAPGNAASGEAPAIAWANAAKFWHNQESQVENDTARNFVAIDAALSGKSIEQLSKVNTQDATNRWARLVAGMTLADTLAGASTHVIAGLNWMQGEANYSLLEGGASADKATYKTLLKQLIADWQAAAITVTGQALPPAFFTYQTGAQFTFDTDSTGAPGLHVGMAQLETVLETANTWMWGPIYPYTDKGGHLDANGSRWAGSQLAKVYHQVVRLGRQWQPLRPVRITATGRFIYIDFHVPAPPLAFDLPYVVNTATSYADKGFFVTDASGTSVAITGVTFGGDTIVVLECAANPGANAHVWYADKTHHAGGGMLRDSDAAVAVDNYIYEPTRGMYTSANIAALVDKPYPLQNWCVAFFLPIDYSEI